MSMASSFQRYASHHYVSLDKFDASMDAVMKAIPGIRGRHRKKSILPTLIGIEINYNGQTESVRPLVEFFTHLKKLQQTHFVRFVIDNFWVLELENDFMYTDDGPKEDYCDIVWTLRMSGNRQVEIATTVVANAPHENLIADLSVYLKDFVPGVAGEAPHDSQFYDMMVNLFRHTRAVPQARFLQEHFHILLVPTASQKNYYPIPIWGMSYYDAKRRYQQTSEALDFNRIDRDDILTYDVSAIDIMHHQIAMIQENEQFGCRANTAQLTYAYAELLFGAYASMETRSESPHDMILFRFLPDNNTTTDVFRFSLDDIAHVA